MILLISDRFMQFVISQDETIYRTKFGIIFEPQYANEKNQFDRPHPPNSVLYW